MNIIEDFKNFINVVLGNLLGNFFLLIELFSSCWVVF